MSDGKAAVFWVRAISPRGGESAGAGPIHHHLGAGPGSGQPGAEEEVSAPAARAPTPGTRTLQHSFLLVRYFGQRSDNRTMEQYDGTHSVKTCLSSVICIVQYTSHNISPYKIREMLNATSSFRAPSVRRSYLVARRPVFPPRRRHHHHHRGQVLGLALAADKNLTLDTGSHSRRHV